MLINHYKYFRISLIVSFFSIFKYLYKLNTHEWTIVKLLFFISSFKLLLTNNSDPNWKKRLKKYEKGKKNCERERKRKLKEKKRHAAHDNVPMSNGDLSKVAGPLSCNSYFIFEGKFSLCESHGNFMSSSFGYGCQNTVRTQIRSWPDNEDRQDSGFIWFARERSRNSDFTEKKILKNVYYYK